VWIQDWIPDPPPPPPKPVKGTADMFYPTWSPTGDFLVTDNMQELALGTAVPHSTKITPTGDIILENIAGNSVWAGMPTVNPRQPSQVAFAGEWRHGRPNGDYKQDENYILIFDMSTQELRPLEPGTPTQPPFDRNFQGRAPWWSPDGNWIVFESSRRDPQGQLYAIFIKNTNPFDLSPAMQVTSVEWNANHAKWYPDGKQLVVSVVQKPGETARGIACLDVSAFVRFVP
jgi:hypothetical protein